MGRYYNSGIGKGIGTSPQTTLQNQLYENKVKELEEINKKNEEDKEKKQTLCSEKDLDKLENAGVKFNRTDVIFVAKTKEGKLVWLEKGNDSAGLKHIVKEHGKQFVDAGISIDKIPQILIETLNIGEYVGIQGKDRKVYKVDIEDSNIFIAISISDNGFIVGANITTKYKEKK